MAQGLAIVEWWEHLPATPRLVILAILCSLFSAFLIWIGVPYTREIAVSALLALLLEVVVLAAIASRGHGFTTSQFRWTFIIVVFVGGFVINRILDGSIFESWVVREYDGMDAGPQFLVAWTVSGILLGVVTWMVIQENHR